MASSQEAKIAFRSGKDSWNSFVEDHIDWTLEGENLDFPPIERNLSETPLGADWFSNQYVLKSGSCREADFSNIDRIGSDPENVDFSAANFRNGNLRAWNFFKCNLSNADFTGAYLEQTSFNKCTLYNISFVDASLSMADFMRSDLSDCDLRNTRAEGLDGCILASCQIDSNTLGPYSRDRWSILARTYSFQRLIFDLSMLIIALLPNLLIALILLMGIDIGESFRSLIDDSGVRTAVEQVNFETKEYSLIYVALGGIQSPFLALLSISIIVLKFVRILITYNIVNLDRETLRTMTTPRYWTFRFYLRGAMQGIEKKHGLKKSAQTFLEWTGAYFKTYGPANIYHHANLVIIFSLSFYALLSYWPLIFKTVVVPMGIAD